MDTPYANWIVRWQAALDACERKGGKVSELVIQPPASEAAVAEIEAELGVVLPPSFRKVLTEFSSQVEAYWNLPNGLRSESDLAVIYGGEIAFGLETLRNAEEERCFRIDNRYAAPDDPRLRGWHDKVALLPTASGEIIAFDMAVQPAFPFVYLGTIADPWHEFRLGGDFIDFMDRWSLLGCPGNEILQMSPFLPDAVSGLDAYGENGQKWREWFGLDFEVNKP